MDIKKYFDESAGKDTLAVLGRWVLCVAGLAAIVGVYFAINLVFNKV